MTAVNSDALVFFGAKGDLAYKKIFPGLRRIVNLSHRSLPWQRPGAKSAILSICQLVSGAILEPQSYP